jgi:hypothetical protein
MKNSRSLDLEILKVFLGGEFETDFSYLLNGGSIKFIEGFVKLI